MKIICTKSNLAKGVSIVSKAVPSKTTMPILECILIDASTDEIKLTANDMELGIETKIEGDIVERGIIALNARIFSEIVRKMCIRDRVQQAVSAQTPYFLPQILLNLQKLLSPVFFSFLLFFSAFEQVLLLLSPV